MQLILDTSAIIGWSRVDKQAFVGYQYRVSALSRAEMVFGIRVAPSAAEKAKRIRRLNDWDMVSKWLPFDFGTADHYGELAEVVHKAGARMKARSTDIFVAAHAQQLGAGLVTFNCKDVRYLSHLIPIFDAASGQQLHDE